MKDFSGELDWSYFDRRSLPRRAPASRIWAAVENMTRNEMLGTAEVADFSGLGVALCGLASNPVAALGDRLWVTLIADAGIIPLQATLVHIKRDVFGVEVTPPSEAGQQFLLRLYERAVSCEPFGANFS